jgi:uncharacterized circularly permuted ATP-grasp superfamily protein
VRFERRLPAPNEVFDDSGDPRPRYRPVLEELEELGAAGWRKRTEKAHELLLEEQREVFGILEGDKTHPTDWMPRIVPAADWERLERGLVQRYRAINEFLRRLEVGKEEVVPEEVIESSILYDTSVPNRFGKVPVRQVAFDIVAVEESGRWEYQILEENAKMPVGLAPLSRRRKMVSEVVFPEAYERSPVYPVAGWLQRLGESLRAASGTPDPTLAVVSGGPEDQFYLDHHIYAREMDAVLAEVKDLGFDSEGYLVHTPSGRRIDVVYERVDEDVLYAELPELVECHVEGRVHVLFAPNSEIVDDKGVYAFIPEMVRTYLGEEPLLHNPRTWSLAIPEDYRYVMDNFEKLVVKSRGGYGGKEVMIGPEESKESVEKFRRLVEADPTEFIAQEVVDFSTHVVCTAEGDEVLMQDSYADYRILGLAPDDDTIEIVPAPLTRVAAPGSHLTNISSGGKMKDTWVLER